MLINLNVQNKQVMIAGGGSVGERMALKFLGEGCNVVVGSKDFTDKLKQSTENPKLKLVPLDADKDTARLRSLIAGLTLS